MANKFIFGFKNYRKRFAQGNLATCSDIIWHMLEVAQLFMQNENEVLNFQFYRNRFLKF